MGRVEEGDGGLVGRGLLVLPVGKHHAHRGVGAAEGGAHAKLTDIAGAGHGTRGHGGEADDLHHQRGGLRFRYLRPQPRQMAAFDVAAFVRDHADQLIGRLCIHDRAGMHEHVVAVDDEGVEGAVVDDVDIDVLRAEPGGFKDRLRIGPQQRFRLSVADQPGGVRRGGRHQRQREASDGGAAEASQGLGVHEDGRGRHVPR